jgi:hypothetical protein
MSRLVHLVADYGPADLGYAELIQRLALAVPSAVVHLTPVAHADTVAAGFCVAQLALTDGPPDRLVVHDIGSPGAADDRLCAGRTRDGVWIIGPNVGWSWSFAIDELPSLCHVDVTAGGSVLRARETLPVAITHVTRRHPHAISDLVPRASIPPVPERVVAYIDDAGNVKTTIAEAPGATGTRVEVRIGRVSARAIVSGSQAVPEGELALAIGSSGWPTRRGGRRCFLELVVGGGSAAERFSRPLPGTRVGLRLGRSGRAQREL